MAFGGPNQAFDFAQRKCVTLMHRLILKNKGALYSADMTLDEKIRLGMVALTGAGLVFATLGLKMSPLEVIGGFGVS